LRLASFLLVAVVMCAGVKSTGADELDIERTVCGSIREPLMFWIYRSLAGEPSSTRLTYVRNLERVDFVARDGIRLGGYKLAGAAPRKGYLLVAQGNAMLADQLVTSIFLIIEGTVFRQGKAVWLPSFPIIPRLSPI
jgi:hypothetical protein